MNSRPGGFAYPAHPSHQPNRGQSSQIAYREVKVASPTVVHSSQLRTARVPSSSTSPLTTPEMLSADQSLRESSRANIQRPTHTARQPSATLSWDKSPKEAWLATPQDSHSPTVPHVAYQDPVEAQFDQLLVSKPEPDQI